MKKIALILLIVLTACSSQEEFTESDIDPSIWGFENSANLKLELDSTYGGSTMTEDEHNYYFTISLKDESTIMYKMNKDTENVEILNDDPTSFCSEKSLLNCTSFGDAAENSHATYPIYYNNNFYFTQRGIDEKTNDVVFSIHKMNMETNDQSKLVEMSTGDLNIPMFTLHRGYMFYPKSNLLMINNIETNGEKVFFEFDESVKILRIEPVGDIVYVSLSGYKKSPSSIIGITMDGEIKEEYLGKNSFRMGAEGMILFEEKDGEPAVIHESYTGARNEISKYPNALVFKAKDFWVIDQIFGEDSTEVIKVDLEGNILSSRQRDMFDFYGLGVDDTYFYTSWRDDTHYQIRRYNLEDGELDILIEMER